ncbi:hypothetical protein L6270_01045 [Candidatus Parcubacteria bacterium]|nr:hypothetical protein [Patescibacteria group bacterium]MBU4309732.1 hypothetical protein [Patescibacteria group bacterium]MBU4432118.1 hypothetical protein [Patescibacteria group bacterium]MBU4577880.1 hypothetical protein [Patescibacteria group bacterium]MCG2696609.1 hypothetical protein [Candidatus Parcubacteria bacterium]
MGEQFLNRAKGEAVERDWTGNLDREGVGASKARADEQTWRKIAKAKGMSEEMYTMAVEEFGTEKAKKLNDRVKAQQVEDSSNSDESLATDLQYVTRKLEAKELRAVRAGIKKSETNKSEEGGMEKEKVAENKKPEGALQRIKNFFGNK